MRRLAFPFLLVAAMLSCEKSSDKPTTTAAPGDTPVKPSAGQGIARTPTPPTAPARLELVSAVASRFSVGAKDMMVYLTTLKVTLTATGPLPDAANDAWVLGLYISGSVDHRLATKMLQHVGWEEAPKGSKFAVESTSTPLDGKFFRFDVLPLKLDAGDLEEKGLIEKRPCYAFILSPVDEKERWQLTQGLQVAFPVLSDRFRRLMRGAERPEDLPDDPSGTAAICLCGFRSKEQQGRKLAVLTEPLVIDLDPARLPKLPAPPPERGRAKEETTKAAE